MKIIYSESIGKMEFIGIKFVIFQLEMDLLWIIKNQRSEKSWNQHFRETLQIDLSNDIQIMQFIYQ